MDTRLIHGLIDDFVEACHPSRRGEIDEWYFDSKDSMDGGANPWMGEQFHEWWGRKKVFSCIKKYG